MIVLRNVSKRYPSRQGYKQILNGVNLSIQKGEVVGILGRNGAGKSTLIRLLSGAERPTSGEVFRGMSVSWPLAFGGGFQGSLTGLDNVRFVCRVYGVEIDNVVRFVKSFSELDKSFYEPVKTYSTGMATRLAFAISAAINFDCYLIDEVIAVGDSRFHQKCHDELFVAKKDAAKVIVSHQPELISAYCNRAAVISGGALITFDSVDAALEHYLNE